MDAVLAAFAAEREEEERQEAGGKDIEDADFRDDPEDDFLDSPGSLRDFMTEEDEGTQDLGSPHASAFSDDSDLLPGRPFVKSLFKIPTQKRRRVVLESSPMPERSVGVPHSLPSASRGHSIHEPQSVGSQRSSQLTSQTLSQAFTPSVPKNREIQPFEVQPFTVVQKAPVARVIARIPNKFEQFRVFSLMQGLWAVALNYANNVGRDDVDLTSRGTSVSDFVREAQDLANFMQGLREETLPEEACMAKGGVRVACKGYDPTPTDEEEAEEPGRGKRKKDGQEGQKRLQLISYIQVTLGPFWFGDSCN
jgi:hypothetical protein